MGKRPKTKMDISNRAKQFMPFAALKGFEEAIASKEKIKVEHIELSEEMISILDEKLRQLHKGDMVSVTYFCKGEYLKKTGLVARIDASCQLLQIVDTKITFSNILDIVSM